MQKAIQNQSFAGYYMPELISRGFEKINWNKHVHNAIKLKWTQNHDNDK